MFVPCPHCGFLVALIVSKGGAVQHCPRCKQRLEDDLDETGTVATPIDASEPRPEPASKSTAVEPPIQPAAAPEREASSSTAAAARAPRRRHRAPSFVRATAPARPPTGPRWPGGLAIAALGVLLGAQLLLAQRHELAASEDWRPLLDGACTVLGCELPPWHEPTAYTMLARNVQPTDRPGVLQVSASFRNDARWPQPWPALSLSLSDVRGQAVAQRTFAPAEYRGDEATATRIAPGQSASVQFDVVEPASPIVAFTFEFR
ncbi:DUF3426 domain-containing protein [Novilysobacter erysipheiresistens]|uniref:DUF3426 domain-containing protein n=1 Tax=Novilysobacter erysipheiresistens TaxID=1749332 RepID=A0ABU7YZL4_9GAMM